MGSRPENDRQKINALTGLRGLAATMVFFHHYYKHWHWVEGRWATFIRSGEIGVSIFFTLSGFLITRSYAANLERGQLPLSQYFLRRAFRILPIYWTLLAVCCLISPMGATFQQLWPAVTLTQAYVPSAIWSTGLAPISWSLTVEETFYIVAPFLFYLAAHWMGSLSQSPVKAKLPWLKYALVVSLTALLWIMGSVVLCCQPELPPRSIFAFNIFGRFGEFGIGIMVAWLLDRPRKKHSLIGREAPLVGFVLLLLMAMLSWQDLDGVVGDRARSSFPERYIPLFWLVSAATSLFILAAVRGGRGVTSLFGNPVCEYLGRVSYCLYLLQAQRLSAPLRSLAQAVSPGAFEPFALFLITVVCAAICYHLLEAPAHRWAVRRWSGGSGDVQRLVSSGGAVGESPAQGE